MMNNRNRKDQMENNESTTIQLTPKKIILVIIEQHADIPQLL